MYSRGPPLTPKILANVRRRRIRTALEIHFSISRKQLRIYLLLNRKSSCHAHWSWQPSRLNLITSPSSARLLHSDHYCRGQACRRCPQPFRRQARRLRPPRRTQRRRQNSRRQMKAQNAAEVSWLVMRKRSWPSVSCSLIVEKTKSSDKLARPSSTSSSRSPGNESSTNKWTGETNGKSSNCKSSYKIRSSSVTSANWRRTTSVRLLSI